MATKIQLRQLDQDSASVSQVVSWNGSNWVAGNQSLIPVTQFGAVLDGTTNDATAIQSAIDTIGYAFFPYVEGSTISSRINSSILLNDGNKLFSNNRKFRLKAYTSSGSATTAASYAIRMEDTKVFDSGTTSIGAVEVSSISIEILTAGANGIWIRQNRRAKVDSVNLLGINVTTPTSNIAIYIDDDVVAGVEDGSAWNYINDFVIYKFITGIHLDTTYDTLAYCNRNLINNGLVQSCTNGVYMRYAYTNQFLNVSVQNSDIGWNLVNARRNYVVGNQETFTTNSIVFDSDSYDNTFIGVLDSSTISEPSSPATYRGNHFISYDHTILRAVKQATFRSGSTYAGLVMPSENAAILGSYSTGTDYEFKVDQTDGYTFSNLPAKTTETNILWVDGSGVISTGTAPSSGGYTTIEEDATALTQRTTLRFVGDAFTAADNAGGARTDVSAAAILEAIADLGAGTGILVKDTTGGTVLLRSIAATANQISVDNNDGSAGNPTIRLANNLTMPGSIGFVPPTGTTGQETGTTAGQMRYNSTTGRVRQYYNSTWQNVGRADDSFVTIQKAADSGFTWGSSDVVADSATDTLRIVAGANITIDTDATNDAIRISSTGGATLGDADYGDIVVSSSGTVMTIDTNVVTDSKIRQSAGLSVIGRSANSTGNVADITGTSDQVLRVSGTTLGFGQIATAGITDAAVTYAKIQNVTATNRILGRSTAGAGVIEEITVGGDITQSGSSFTVVSASDTVAGKVELATTAETSTGTDATRAVTPDSLSGSVFGQTTVGILVSDPLGSAITTGDGKAYLRIPTRINGFNLTEVGASVSTVSSSGAVTVQIRRVRSGTPVDMLSTALTIDASETDSSTAATAAVINTSNDDIATADQIYIDIDGAGTGTKGLFITLTFTLP